MKSIITDYIYISLIFIIHSTRVLVQNSLCHYLNVFLIVYLVYVRTGGSLALGAFKSTQWEQSSQSIIYVVTLLLT
mgnify:CR=1 FL=1